MTCRLGRVHGRLISACAAGDLLDPISDDVTYQLVRQLGRLTGFVADRYRTACSSSPEAWSTPIAGYGEPKGPGCRFAGRRSGNSPKETLRTSR